MSVPTVRQWLIQLLSRFLKSLSSTHRLITPFRLINQLFAFFASITRWARTNPRTPTLHRRQVRPPISSASMDSGITCAMTVPSDAHERSRLSPVDSPYAGERSPSGHLTPYPPTLSRRYSIPWMGGSQTSFHNEPSEINLDTSQAAADSMVQSSSSLAIHTHHGDHAPSSDILTHPSHPPSVTIGFALDTLPGTPEVKSSPHAAQLHFDANKSEPNRSGTPFSMKSSQHTVSSAHSRSSGRASYREHRGPPVHVHVLASDQDAPVDPSSTLTGAEPGCFTGSAPFLTNVATPCADDPSRSGELINVGPCRRSYPMSVSGVLRYDDRRTRGPSEPDYTIEAMSCRYRETPENVPEGWRACRHPEGALYFVHSESKTFAEVNICNEEIYADIEHFRTSLFSKLKAEIRKQNSEFLQVGEVQLVLEPKRDDLGFVCCYYFVNPRTRCLFWLSEWKGYEIFKDCRSDLSLPHKGLGVQAHYWSHWDLYPNFCEVTQELKGEVVDMILHATCDHLTSSRSSCPLNPEELQKYLSLIDRIDPGKTAERKHSAIIIGRIMHIFYHNYFLNFHGEECARLNFDQRIYGWRYHPSRFMTIFALFSFMAPVKNVRLLHRVFVDDIASKEKWNMFVANLNSQLQESSVLATVLLNANVGFLPKQSGAGTSLQAFFGYMSLISSVASIILGLVFMGHSRTEARNTPFEAATFLHGLWHEKHGLERLAIVYSLPQAFLIWGMGLFSAAFMVQWYHLGNTQLRDGAGAFMLVVALLVAWCIWTARDRSDRWWFQSDPS
ncbi:hypothetical protein EV363DRAFT_1318110 [Boletus edulis]|nr:hypothetical protein EV363DRAFT_1318110 [Boletus edulis]